MFAKVTGAPLEITVDGKKFRFSPLTDKDFGEFENWLQYQIIEKTVALLDKAPEQYRAGILEKAYAKAASISITSPETSEFMQSLDGGAKLLMLSLRKEHPDIEELTIKDLMLTKEFSDQMLSALDWLNDTADPNPPRRKKRRPPKPKKKKKKR